jgi:putative LysE/RhtB family amino acid efflux pump
MELARRIADQYEQEFSRAEADHVQQALRLLGAVPAGFDLRDELVDAVRETVGGYYTRSRSTRGRALVHALLVGFGFGFLVAMQLGPMSLFLIRSTLRRGLAVGLAIGAGIAAVDALYSALGAAGAAPLLTIGPLELVLGVVGGIVVVALGSKTLASAFRVRHGGEADLEVADPRRAFLTSLGATASNPLTIASWAAVFAAATAAGAADSAAGAALLVAGVGIGSAVWVTSLATGVAIVRRSVGERAMRVADVIAGLGLLAFGSALIYGAFREQ